MKKVEISMEEERDDSFSLAEKLYNSGVRPTFIYGVTRGGNYIAGPMSEYFKWRYSRENFGIKPIIGSVVAHEYSYENRPGDVIVEGWAPSLSRISEKDTVLLCDDCFDTGNTIKALVKDIELHTPLRKKQSPLIMIGNDIQLNDEIKTKPSKYPSPLELRAINFSMLQLIDYIRLRCPEEIFDAKYEYFTERRLIVATHDLKQFLGEHVDENFIRLFPDVTTNIFYCKGKWGDKFGPWIQYDRYEMMGLTDEEIMKKYRVK